MSEEESLKKQSEVEKILAKLRTISIKLGAKDIDQEFETKSIQDEFERLRVELNFKINETDKLIDEKEKIEKATSGTKIQEKYKLEKKIDDNIDEIKKDYGELQVILNSQKKNKKKFGDSMISKEESFKLLGDRFDYIKCRNEGILDNEEKEKNKYTMEKLDDLLGTSSSGGGGAGATDETFTREREIYKEEQDKIDQWDEEVKSQEEIVDKVATNIHVLKGHAGNINKKQDDISKKVKDVTKSASHTEQKLETTNKKLKDLLEKLGNDKICVDIILVLICLGLCAVLYNVIKGSIESGETDAKTANKTSTLLY